MSAKHLNLMFPQWQGGGQDLSTYDGAKEFRSLYLDQVPVAQIEVDTEPVTETVNRIFGYPQIASQLIRAHTILRQEAPDAVFTLGGGCDAGIPAAAYLNRRLDGDMTVLWFDSHGDLNTPLSSCTGLFYGMPLRTLLGDGDEPIIAELPSTLLPSQVMMFGARDLDGAERMYIQTHAVPIVSVADIERDIGTLLNLVRSKNSRNLYIHIDLDVLEPAQFPHVPLPAPGGLRMETLQALLCALHAEFNIAGLDVMEYSPTGNKRYPLFAEICRIGTGGSPR